MCLELQTLNRYFCPKKSRAKLNAKIAILLYHFIIGLVNVVNVKHLKLFVAILARHDCESDRN